MFKKNIVTSSENLLTFTSFHSYYINDAQSS